MLVIIVIILMFILIGYLFYIYNNIANFSDKIAPSFITLDTSLKKRWTLIPNIINITKQYSECSKEVIEELTKLYNTNYDKLTTNEKIIRNNKVSSDIYNLISPIKDKLYNNEIINNLISIEKEINVNAQVYNSLVKGYNNLINPTINNIISRIYEYKPYELYKTISK